MRPDGMDAFQENPAAEAALEEACTLELRLLDPAVRSDRRAAERLLHPDFVEIGGSGRVWDRASVLNALGEEQSAPPAVTELKGEWLTRDAVLVTYRAQRPDDTASLRASVWLRDAHGWRVRFHQGTPATE
jgi:ribonuclease HI